MGAESECSGRDPASSAHNNVGFSPRRSDTGGGGGGKGGRLDTADFLISVAEQAEEEEKQGSLLGSRMASSQAMQWVGDQQRVLPQTDAAVLASSARAQFGPSGGMWQPSSHLSASGIGAAPASAAMATDHPALGFSLLQNRMNPAVKSEPGQAHGPHVAGQNWGHQFSAMPPFSCDYGALNPMPVVPPSDVLSAMNQSNPPGQDFSAGFLPRHAGQFEPSGSQLFSSSSLLSLPSTFGMSGASSYSALQSSTSFDTFSQLTPKSFGADSSMPRPASMPSLLGGPVQFEPGTGMPNPSGRRKGRGGRTAAMDPRLDPSIDPKRAKRILANRLSAARSKSKQRGHLDVLEGAHATLVQQKDELLKEAAWLRAEIKLMEEEGPKLEGQLKALEEHALLQEALQIKLLEECGHQSPFGGDSSATAPGSRPDRHD